MSGAFLFFFLIIFFRFKPNKGTHVTSSLHQQFPNSPRMKSNSMNSLIISELKVIGAWRGARRLQGRRRLDHLVTGGSPACTWRGGGPRPSSGEGTRGGGSELRAWGGSPRREERDRVDGERRGCRDGGEPAAEANGRRRYRRRNRRPSGTSRCVRKLEEGDETTTNPAVVSARRGREQSAGGELESPD